MLTKKNDKSPTGAPIKMVDRVMSNTFYTDVHVLYK